MLIDFLRHEINTQGGFISFARFMEAALYHPQFGYYNSPHFTLGKLGDFTTAPELSPLFAKCLTRHIDSLSLPVIKKSILEIGAGTGRLASDLLAEFAKNNSEPIDYYIYEISPSLRNKQQLFLKKTCPEQFSRIIWLDELPKKFTGIIIANEVLDALPVHCFCIKGNEIKERCVTWHEDQFRWKLCQPLSAELQEKVQILKDRYSLPAEYESEINLYLPKFIQSITAALTQGLILFIDYGYGQAEYYRQERKDGTLTCFHKHQANHNPFLRIGLQDITAHVDFTSVIESAVHDECDLLGYTTQAAFLLNYGLLDFAVEEEKKLTSAEQVNLHQAIKLLTM